MPTPCTLTLNDYEFYCSLLLGTLYINMIDINIYPAQSPPRCTKCSSSPINGQCTNFILFDVAL